MELYIGGYAQGKLKCALLDHAAEDVALYDAKLPPNGSEKGKTVILYHLNDMIRRLLDEGGNPRDDIMNFVWTHPDCVIISDEIGCGIVPVSQEERDFRDAVGQIQIELSKAADRVVRVICGIAVKIK